MTALATHAAGRKPARRRTGQRSIRYAVYVSGLLGLALLTYLVAEAGAAAVASALLVIGWGVLAVVAYRFLPMVVSTLSWRDMLPANRRAGLWVLCWARWIRDSINTLLPVGQIGGDLVAARLVHRRGTPGAAALGSVVVDLTVGVLTQMAFLAGGLALLLLYSTDAAVLSVVWSALIGMAVMLACMVAFLLLQRKGVMGLGARIAGGLLGKESRAKLAVKAGDTDAAIRAIYRSGSAIRRAFCWRLAAWVLGAGEIWLIMYFLGKPIDIGQAIVIESFAAAVRSVFFLVPGAIGVMEGGFIVFGQLFGISTADSLAMALGRRVREVLMGVPGLVAWQVAEGRHLLRRQ